jgi:hypothetical protein
MKRFKGLKVQRLNEKGVALVMALIIGLAVLVIATGIIYFIIQSTIMSGAGKRYTTASEAADGAVEVMKDGINLILMAESIGTLLNTTCNEGYPLDDLYDAVLTENLPCTVTLNLPGTAPFTDYNATITVERLYSATIPGGRIEFARAGGGAPTTGVYFRINTVVTGPGGTTAESSALYRYTM